MADNLYPDPDLFPSDQLYPAWVGEEEPPEPQSEIVGGSRGGPRSHGGGPWMFPWEQRISGRVRLARPMVVSTRGRVTATSRPRVEISFPGTVTLYKQIRVEFSGRRTEAQYWNRLLAEDEDLLLTLDLG